MRLVIQRVLRASVGIAEKTVSEIGKGLLVLVGVESGDTEEDMRWLVGKTAGMRIFNDENGVMNRSVADVGGRGSCSLTIHIDGLHEERKPSFVHTCRGSRCCGSVVRKVLRWGLDRDRQACRQRSLRCGHAGITCKRRTRDDHHRLPDTGIGKRK